MKLSKTISVLVAAGMIACLGAGCNKPTSKDTGSSSTANGSDSSVSTGSTDLSTVSGTSAVSGTSGTSGTVSGTVNVTSGQVKVSVPKSVSDAGKRLAKAKQVVQDLSKVNLHGRTVNIGAWYGYQSQPGTDEEGKRQAAQNALIQQTANCKFAWADTGAGTKTQFKASILAGKPSADFSAIQGAGLLYDYYSAGCLTDLAQYKLLDINDRTRYMADDLAVFNGKRYGVVPTTVGWLNRNYNNVLIGDMDLLAQAGHPASEIYGWIKAGQWNWANFEKVCNDVVTKIPGVYACDEKGTTRYTGINMDFLVYQSLLWSDNCDWIGKKNNKFTFTGGTGNAMKVLNQYVKWYQKGYIKYQTTNDIYSNYNAKHTAFLPDIYLMSTHGMASDNHTNGCLQYPMGPDAKKYNSYGVQNHWIVIPKGVKDAQQIAGVMQAFCAPLYTLEESRQHCMQDCEGNNKSKESIDENMRIYDDPDAAKCGLALYGTAAHLDIATKTAANPGWFDYVHKVAAGQMTPQQAVTTFTSRCNSVLSTTFN